MELLGHIYQDRTSELDEVLQRYLDIVGGYNNKSRLLNAYTFEKPASVLRLGESSKRRDKFIRELRNFMFVGQLRTREVFGFSELVLVSRFRNTCVITTDYVNAHQGHFHKLPDLARVSLGFPLRDLGTPHEQIEWLEELIDEYSYLFTDGGAKDQILDAFRCKKPVTSIELSNVSFGLVAKLSNALDDFFCVGHAYADLYSRSSGFTGDILVSRYITLFDIAMSYARRYNCEYDRFADLAGFLFLKEDSKKVATYCLDEKRRQYDLVM